MDDDPIIRIRATDTDSDDSVTCARCRRKIPPRVTRCPLCKVHFRGEAWEFSQEENAPRLTGKFRRHLAVGIALSLVGMFVLLLMIQFAG